MNIQNISKTNKEAVVRLSSDELVTICNAMYKAGGEEKDKLFHKLNSELMLTRDMCIYGHVDDFCLEKIVESRMKCSNIKPTILTEEEIEVFNAYIDSGDMKTAFGNTDWNAVYRKIVREHASETAKRLMEESIC